MFEDLKKTTRGGAAPGARRGLLGGADPKFRLYLMIAAAVVLGVIMLGLEQFAGDPENQVIKDAGEPAYDPGLPREERFSGVPPLDPKYRERIEDETGKERRWWQNDVMSYLLYEAKNTPAVHAYKTNLFPLTRESAQVIRGGAPGGADEAEEASGSEGWRYQYVRFRGVLETPIEEINYEAVHGEGELPVGQVHRARVLLGGEGPEARVLFYTPMPPTWTDKNAPVPYPPTNMIEEGWIRGRGIFVKRFVDTRGRQSVPCLLVVATHIARDYERVEVESLADIPFGLIRDSWELKETNAGRALLARLFPRPLFRLVQYAAERAGEEGAEGAERRAAEGLEPTSLDDPAKFERVMTRPAQYRADYFGGLGAIAWTLVLPAEPNDAGIEEYLTGHLVTDKQKLIEFIAPISLDRDWQQRDRIRYEGFFYKTKLYRTIANKDKIVPTLVLTRLEIVEPPPPNRTLPVVIVSLFVLGLGALAFLVLRDDKTKESFRRQARRRRRIAEARASSEG